MRTSRISQDTTRALSTSSSAASPRTTRTTRSSLARFALKPESSPPLPDIEDAIPRVPSTRAALKRKRASPSTKPAIKDEIKPEPASDIDSALSSPPSSPEPQPAPKRKTRQPARTIKTANGDVAGVTPPSDWETIYDLVKQMRTQGAARDAAVDTMGCHALALKTASPRDQRFQTLISLMLSSQTKDTTNYIAMRNLQTNLPACTPDAAPGLTLENILAVDADALNRMIWSVGFHNNKTKYIKAAAEILRDRHAGDIPDTAEGLMALPGVGPKMAYLCLSAAWGRVEGIGVDVHVHRIVNLWGWHRTAGPEATRVALQAWLPRERWAEINWLLVGLGQTVCTPEVGRRRCGECEVGLRGLCRASDKAKVNVGRRAREEGLKVEYERKSGEVEEMKAVKEEGGGETVVDAAPGAGGGHQKAETKVKTERNDIPLSAVLKLEEDEELGKASGKDATLP